MSRTREPVKHGTYGGYQAHKRRGEDACDECKAANTQYRRNAREAVCGTDSGYFRHRRKLNEPPCYECTRAHAAAERDRVARKAAGFVRPRCQCGSAINTDQEKCYTCRRVEGVIREPEPVFVLRGGVWRALSGEVA